MTLSESLALFDDGHIYSSINHLPIYICLVSDKKNQILANNSIKKQKQTKNPPPKKTGPVQNVQAQTVSKQAYLHPEIKTKYKGEDTNNPPPPRFNSPPCRAFFHQDDTFGPKTPGARNTGSFSHPRTSFLKNLQNEKEEKCVFT